MAVVAASSPNLSDLNKDHNHSNSSKRIAGATLSHAQDLSSGTSKPNASSRTVRTDLPDDVGSEDDAESAPAVRPEGELGPDDELPEPICGGCKRMIDEESADAGVIHFATQLWHVDCFRCAKCRNPVTTDRDDILLLSDGHPICGQCNYSCQICNLPIMEEAIMTGDESYHASCFVCRSCRTPIAELVFAKTSQGIYCMKCHNQRVARSRRHAEKKRAAAAAAASAQASTSGSSNFSSKMSPSLSDGMSGPPSSSTIAGEPKSPVVSLTPGSPLPESGLGHNEQQRATHPTDMSASSSSLSTLSPFLHSSSSSSLARPGSAGQNTKRPLHAPPLSPLRGSRGNNVAARPSTADSANTGEPARAAQVTAQQSALAKLEGDMQSPLLAGALEHVAAMEQRQSRTSRERSQSRTDENFAEALAATSNDRGRTSEEVLSNEAVHEPAKAGTDLSRQQHSKGQRRRSNDKLAPRASYTSSRIDDAGESADGIVDGSAIEGDESQQEVQYKRASRLTVGAGGGDGPDGSRLSRAFSFYDPDIVGLMDSFGQFESYEELTSEPVEGAKTIDAERGVDRHRRAALDLAGSATRATSGPIETIVDDGEVARTMQASEKRNSASSLSQLSETMRQSLQQARDGHVSMDTGVIESTLDELEATRERMKILQRKYDRIRRASQQAAQGFSSAREEYEQEVQARYDAEAEMLKLKRQLHLQASKLAEMATEKRQQETLNRRNHEVRSSIQDMEKDLSKLRIERDMTVAEVAELVSMQDGRSMPHSGHEEAIARSLVTRLDGLKDKYRHEIELLVLERDALSEEIEELRQSRDVFLEETQNLNARNDELNGALVLLQNRVEHAQAAHALASRRDVPSSSGPQIRSGAGAFGFSFGGAGGSTAKVPKSPLSAASTIGTIMTDTTSSNTLVPDGSDQLAIATPVSSVTKIEAAPKKFKWMKAPKLTADSARFAGHHLASALPGITPPVPPKGGHAHSTSVPLQQQHAFATAQQQQGSHTLPQPLQSILNQPHISNANAAPSHQHKASQDHPSGNGMSPGEIVVKEHLFQPFNVLRPVRCLACQKNMWGQSEMKCSFCNQACHVRCLHNLPISCNQPFSRSDEPAIEPNGPSMFGRNLVEQVRAEGNTRSVPIVVEKCVEVVESQGMDYEGIYRKSGGTSQLKIITQLFEKGQPFNLDDRDRFNDISAITSVLKNYFRELPEPLMTFELHERFIECVEAKHRDATQKKSAMRELVLELPREHFDTLKFLVNHLHRVQSRAGDNRMSSRNLGVVFGPTLMRSRDPSQEFAHMGGKAMTVEFLIDHSDIFD